MERVWDIVRGRKPLSSFQVIIFGFAAVILSGALLLFLPFSSRGQDGVSFLDALFTATSAVCVTGLVIYDTATSWSLFGQGVILALIQTGGMGVVTAAVALSMASGRRIGLAQRSTMQEAIAAPQVGGIVRLTSFILRGTLTIELIGAVVMAPVFCREFGVLRGIWYAVFHSVSAFCNAGFDLMGEKAHFSSLVDYAADPVINMAIMALIVAGGIGFLTWDDARANGLDLAKYRMQSKVIIATTALLIAVPALWFFFAEFTLPVWSGMSPEQRLLSSLFQAVTPRTAGFNTVDLLLLSEHSKAVLIILMLIGGSPGSTAGGMKTTTFAVLLLAALSAFHRRAETQCFGRRIADSTVKHAAVIALMYVMLFLSGGFVISWVEGLPLQSCLFEAASAIGTVGLTLGLTPSLAPVSKVILILLMFFGRVGGLTLVFAVFSETHTCASKLPQEKITTG